MDRVFGPLIVYLTVAIAFVALDALWLSLVAADLFKKQLGDMLREVVDMRAAMAFYIVYAGGLTALAVWPAIAPRRPIEAVIKGGVVGLTAYATFDLTNLAILKAWSLPLSLIDMTWGTVASAVAAACGYACGVRLWSRVDAPSAQSQE